MSEEEIKEIIDKIKQEEFPYALAIAKAYEKLQQENKHLKEKLDIADTNYDIIYDYFSKVNELLGTELCEEVLTEILKLKSENEELKKQIEIKNSGYMASIEEVCEYATALIEFEKWLDNKINFYKNNFQGYSYERYKEILDKLQELKEGKK